MSAFAIRKANRVRELQRMSRSQLEIVEQRVRGGRRIYGKPSRDELITEILRAEDLLHLARPDGEVQS